MIYECNIKKYNYNLKEFKNSGYIGKIKDMKNYFKSCGYIKFKCIFCNKNILQMNLEEHVKKKFIFGIINYPNGDKYIGEKKAITLKTDFENYIIQTEINTKMNGNMIRKKGMENFIIQMEINLKVNRKMIRKKNIEKYIQMEIDMKENGKMINLKDMVFYVFQMEIDMKDNIKMVIVWI